MKRRLSPGVGIGLGAAIAIVGFIFSWHFFGKMNPYNSLMPGNQTVGQVPILLEDVDIRTRAGGQPLWQVHANSLTIAADRQSVSANDLGNGVFFKSGRPALFFSSRHIKYAVQQFYAPTNIAIDGGIDLWTPEQNSPFDAPLHVSTAALNWDGKSALAVFPAPVSFASSEIGSGRATGLMIDSLRRRVYFGAITASIGAKLIDDQKSSGPITPTTPQSVPETDNVTYTASDGYWDDNNRILTILGPVTFQQGKAGVSMVGATYDQKTNVAVSSSPIKFTDTESTVTGDHGTIDFLTHTAVLQGHITMLILPKPEDKVNEPEAKKPTTILCDQINYNYRTKKAHTTGEVVIKQPNRIVTADDGQYDVATKVVDLVGNVVGKSTDGKIIRAPHAKVSVDPNDEWIQLNGPISGTFAVSGQDNPLDSKTKPAAQPGSSEKPEPQAPDSTTPPESK